MAVQALPSTNKTVQLAVKSEVLRISELLDAERGLMDAGLRLENKMNKIVLAVLKEYFEHTTGDVTLEQIETCAQAISEALETAQQSAQLTCVTCDSPMSERGDICSNYQCSGPYTRR